MYKEKSSLQSNSILLKKCVDFVFTANKLHYLDYINLCFFHMSSHNFKKSIPFPV